MAIVDRAGKPVAFADNQAGTLRWLYSSGFGRALLKVLTCPALSKLAGRFMDTRASSRLIGGFVQNNGIDLSDYEQRAFRSFNDFFCRRILPGKRPIDPDESALISPADCKLTVLPVSEDETFSIKEIPYTFTRLVRDEQLAKRFAGGTVMIFRLTVSDYHRYCWPVSGTALGETKIPGILHTVNPIAAERLPIYAENSREYTLIETERFGTVLMMEVGAMLVGKIVNDRPHGKVVRGTEKGHFEYGGSTVILSVQKDKVTLCPELIENSKNGFETEIRMGERVGIAAK